MKKNIIKILSILFIISILIPRFVFAQKQEDTRWTKVNNYIYIDKNSIEKYKHSTVAWLKIYDSGKRVLPIFNGKHVRYEVTKYEAICGSDPFLFLDQIQYYDKKNNLLSDELNYRISPSSCRDYIDGEIICKAICEN